MALTTFRGQRRTLASLADTRALATELAGAVAPGDLLLLTGPVGAGKTTFTGFLWDALGVATAAQSPSYALHRVHESPHGAVHHFDLYRLDSPAAFESLDPWDAMADAFLTVVEWADAVAVPWPEDALTLHLSPQPDGSRRARLQ